MKIIQWVLTNGASILGIAQAILKALKEAITALVNVVSIILPSSAAEKMIWAFRDAINQVDDWVEMIKEKLLGE